MEWQSIIGSAIGSSPAAALSFYWAKAAWKAREDGERVHAQEIAAKDAIIEKKDAQIASLQQARIEDLRAVMLLPPAPKQTQKPQGFGG